jgi:signal transduction histidine kinase
LKIEPIALAELAQDAVLQFRLRARERQVDLQIRPAAGSGMVEGDVGLLARVLDNLLENGIRHTPDGGRVTLGLRETPERVEVEVADTGCGIASEDLPHVFDRFFRDQQRNPIGDHAGLGLAISRQIVELHGGSINVESRLGEGTMFCVSLPARHNTM